MTDRQTDRDRQTETVTVRETDKQTDWQRQRDRECVITSARARLCVCERERERERDRDRDRERQRQIQRQTDRQRHRQRHRQTKQREAERQTERERQTVTDRQILCQSVLDIFVYCFAKGQIRTVCYAFGVDCPDWILEDAIHFVAEEAGIVIHKVKATDGPHLMVCKYDGELYLDSNLAQQATRGMLITAQNTPLASSEGRIQ